MGSVRDFMDRHFLHFNSREVVAAARAWEVHLAAGGRMLLSLAGAMSTARIGRILGRLIQQGKVHAISCTGANLEEDVFNLLAANDYEIVPDWRALRAEDEKALYEQGMNRVTDTCIPETVMRHLERRLLARWQAACERDERKLPAEFLFDVLGEPDLAQHFQIPPEDSWMLAARKAGLPVFAPGWEDSTTGNMFAAAAYRKELPHHQCVKTGTEQMESLMRWYLESCRRETDGPSVGFFQIGGGIAGDFAICAVPTMIQDLKMEDVPFWGYFCQISDAVTSYGGYSGAVPNEKITWGKLDLATPRFMIQSDATIAAPLVFAYLLGD
ncbi:MAG: deoxyhypusine synthase family protein [Deltaproteobacteria bacterium]|nr:deoxyhypusine synthase family protein [Deltaproteobacteria bacterium]